MAKAMVLTKYEKARAIGARALQLALGAPPLLKHVDTINPIDLALREYDEDVLPLQVVREEAS